MTTIDLDPKFDFGVKQNRQIYIKPGCVYCYAKKYYYPCSVNRLPYMSS